MGIDRTVDRRGAPATFPGVADQQAGQNGTMSKRKRKWSELSPRAKVAVAGVAVAHVALVGVAHADLSKRPAAQIRGPKWAWRLLTASNTTFTVAYLIWGRHKTPEEPTPATRS